MSTTLSAFRHLVLSLAVTLFGCGEDDQAVGSSGNSTTSTSDGAGSGSSDESTIGADTTIDGNSDSTSETSTTLPTMDEVCGAIKCLDAADQLRPQQMAAALGQECDWFISPDLCAHNQPLSRGVTVHILYWQYLQPKGKLDGCEGLEPGIPYMEQADDWHLDKVVSVLQCLGLLEAQEGEFFCADSPACQQDWWGPILDQLP